MKPSPLRERLTPLVALACAVIVFVAAATDLPEPTRPALASTAGAR